LFLFLFCFVLFCLSVSWREPSWNNPKESELIMIWNKREISNFG
jgi:hypothetical protein